MLNYFRMVVVSKADYDAAESPELWESHANGDYVVFGLAVNNPERDNKFRTVYLNDNVHCPEIHVITDAYLAGAMQFSRVCGEDIIVVVESDKDRYNTRKIFDLINAGEFYEAYSEECWD